MKKSIIASGLGTFLVLTWLCTAGFASNLRLTPIVRAVKRAKASVVNIHSEKTTRSGDTLFSTSRGRKVNGMGTGIVVDERGYIVTNFHVVNGVDSLRATLHDGSMYDARVIKSNEAQDLSLIKIDPSRPLEVMPTGTSSDIMLGETVIAVGNAFGYEHTVTAGIVSALARNVDVNDKQSYKNLIQTDASINPGNSGGRLLNLDGEVVGINVAIRAGAQRIGFAIPIDDARKIIAQLLNVEQLDRTYHGLRSEDQKSGEDRKLVVSAATPETPAAEAGFQAGDIIVKAGTVWVTDGADFERAILGHSAGEKIGVTVKRKSATETLTLTLTKFPGIVANNGNSKAIVRANNEELLKDKTWQVLGLRLAPHRQNKAKTPGTRFRGGMRVSAVRRGSSAMANGIQPGDVLVGLHIWETISKDDVSFVLEHPKFASFSPLKFYILRGRETMWGYVRPDNDEN